MENSLSLGASAGPDHSTLAELCRITAAVSAGCLSRSRTAHIKNGINILCRRRVLSEHLQKLQLEDLREFLQERLAVSFFLPDDVVIEQLQAATAELRSKKLAQPPPGADAFSFFVLLISSLRR